MNLSEYLLLIEEEIFNIMDFIMLSCYNINDLIFRLTYLCAARIGRRQHEQYARNGNERELLIF